MFSRRKLVAAMASVPLVAASARSFAQGDKVVGPKVFLDYTQEELDRAYDQRVWAANAPEVIARYTSASNEVKRKYPHRTLRYGAHEDEVLDLFPPVRATGSVPVHIFIHGGAWRQLTKDDSAFAAPAFLENGIAYVALNFSVIPKVRLPEMAEQCRRGIAWIAKNAGELGIDPRRIALSGHSSGGHLAAVMLTTDWTRYGIGESPLKAGMTVSGMYDLAPVLLSARSSYVKIDKAEESALSPMRHLELVRCPIAVAYGDGESPEFKRHARDFAAALKQKSRQTSTLIEGRGLNHFEVIETLAKPDGLLGKIALEQIASS
jgi:arylformamidase